MLNKIDCTILTPEKVLYTGTVEFAVVQAYDGEMGYLYNHAPLIAELGIGEIRLKNEGHTDYFIVEGGIVEINNNVLTILAENALAKLELDDQSLQKELKEIRSKLNKEDPGKERFQLQIEEKKVRARLKVALR